MSLSSEEAETFLNNVLQFSGWKKLLQEDKVGFLRVLMAHFAHHLAFQNIDMASNPPDERRVPNDEDIKAAGLSGRGGACVVQNSFLVMLLKALNFNSYVVSGFVHGPRNAPDNHVICVVEIGPEEKYLIDVGVGLPFAEPIAMNRLPYTNKAGGFRYTYKTEDGENFHRVQMDGALFGEEYEDKTTEYFRYDFTMKPQTLQFFQEPLTPIFKEIPNSIFLQHPFMFRYFDEDESGKLLDKANVFGNRKWILIRGVSVLIADDNTRQVTHYANYDEVKQVIFKYFPKFSKEDVEKSMRYFNDTVSEYGYFKAK